MNNSIKFKNGKEYQILIGGVWERENGLLIKVVTDESIEALRESITGAAETLSVLEDGQEITQYSGYSALGNRFMVEEATEGESRAVSFTLERPGVEKKVDANRADIDFLLMMGGTTE